MNAENGRKLILSLVFVAIVVGVRIGLRALVGTVAGAESNASTQTRFWTRQGISLLAAVVLVLGLLSVWFNDPTRLATAFGLLSAGLAVALQQVITSLAGYFVIRGTKDAMTRHIIGELDRAGIGIASATYDIVGLPPLRIARAPRGRGSEARHQVEPPQG